MRHVLPLILPVMLGAMSPTTDRTPEQRQFDFWIGDWEVHDAKGQRLGRNRVELAGEVKAS